MLSMAFLLSYHANSQALLNKVKSAAKDKATDAVFGNKNTSPTPSTPDIPPTGGNGRPTNSTSGGLITTPPDVLKSITEAESAFGSKSYGAARYSLQQAIVGIEMEMGDRVIESLPKKIDGIDYVKESDKVTSTGMAFVGLTIFREYYNDDKAVDITIANNSAMLSAANLYLSNPAYTAGQENMKSVNFQGFRGVLEFSEYDGYKLTVPIGQTSVAIVKLVNMANENEAIAAAGEFNLAEIQKLLGDKIN